MTDHVHQITHAGEIPVEVRKVPHPADHGQGGDFEGPAFWVLLQLPPGTSWVVMKSDSARKLAEALTLTAEQAEA